MKAVGNGPREGCTKRVEPQSPCLFCPPLFPRTLARSRTFDLSRQPTSDEVSAMAVRGLSHVGYDTSLFSGISARRGGISTAIEAGVPEAILWMQSGHAQDVAARRYIQLRSPVLLYKTWEAFGL
uniref:Tyr recombinase domain-containing protein n=1 Tax=Cryptomonas curvata TaxID=233186 RepID=A0A6T8CYB4_9CRYP